MTAALLDDLYPDHSILDFMPDAAGLEPRGDIHQLGTSAHLIYTAIEETGDPQRILMGTSSAYDAEAVPRFSAAARAEGLNQGSYFNFDDGFSREYIAEWRGAIVSALLNRRKSKREGQS
jgi:hypothetical protein